MLRWTGPVAWALVALLSSGCLDYGMSGTGVDDTPGGGGAAVDDPGGGECQRDDDCVLVFDTSLCCGPYGLDDIRSIPRDGLDAWLNDPAPCQNDYCDPHRFPNGLDSLYLSGTCIEAACQEEGCATREVDPFACSADEDCVKVAADCCSCANGGSEIAVHADYAEAIALVRWHCRFVEVDCLAVYLCNDRPPVCSQGRCAIEPDLATCDDCPRLWAPVCGSDFETYDNSCFAECQGVDWYHAGECLEGEGTPCHRLCGVPCPEGQICMGGPLDCDVPRPTGVCIQEGACLDADDCRAQNSPYDDCNDWTCVERRCVLDCD